MAAREFPIQARGNAGTRSIMRAWRGGDIAVTASLSTTEKIDNRYSGGGSVAIPTGSTITSLAVYASHNDTDYDILYDENGVAVTMTVAADGVYELPTPVYTVPYFGFVANAAGTVGVFLKG